MRVMSVAFEVEVLALLPSPGLEMTQQSLLQWAVPSSLVAGLPSGHERQMQERARLAEALGLPLASPAETSGPSQPPRPLEGSAGPRG